VREPNVLFAAPGSGHAMDIDALPAFLCDGQHRELVQGEGEEAHEGISVWNRTCS